MTSLRNIIPIDQNGFFCTSRKSLEASTGDSEFSLEAPQCNPYVRETHTKSSDLFDTVMNIAVVTPEKEARSTSNDKKKDSKAEVKKWARGMLKEEPCKFVTQKGLLLALKHNAPLPVIQFMLKINPNIMNFPKKGPTPLQVAVQCNADLDVIKILLDASPVGECIRNPDFPESPLEFAKRCRSDRPDLIELLSRKTKFQDQDCNKKHKEKVKAASEFTLFPRFSSFPVQQSMSYKYPKLSPPPSLSAQRTKDQSMMSETAASKPKSPRPPAPTMNVDPIFSPPHSRSKRQTMEKIKISPFQTSRPKSQTPKSAKDVLSEVKLPSNTTESRQSQPASCSRAPVPEKRDSTKKSNIAREELNNIKTLCAVLWKSQRKMTKELDASKIEIESQSELLASMGTKDEILDELMKQQRSQMFRNWMALDTKERAYQKRLEEMEQRYIDELEKRLHSWTGSMRLWNESTREQVDELRAFVDSEAETNEYFRSNMTNWIEKYTEDQENNTNNIPSQVFATNLGEIDQKAPLCPGLRGAFCGYGTDTTAGETDVITGLDDIDPPLERVKKRSWRPLSKNRNYSSVE